MPSSSWGFPGGSDSKGSACNAGDLSSVPGLGRSPGDGNGYPLQYSCLENPTDRGDWWATVLGIAESDVTTTFTVTFQCLNLWWLLEQSATDWRVYTHKTITSHCSGGYRSETGRRDGQVPVSAPCLVVEGELTCWRAEGSLRGPFY